jgi:hypothetical protein
MQWVPKSDVRAKIFLKIPKMAPAMVPLNSLCRPVLHKPGLGLFTTATVAVMRFANSERKI